MNSPFIPIDATSYSGITPVLRLAPPMDMKTCDASRAGLEVGSSGWQVHTGRLASGGDGQYLFILVTLWHVCSLLHANFVGFPRHVRVPVCAGETFESAMQLTFSLDPLRRLPYHDEESDDPERLAWEACSSRGMHMQVPILMSSSESSEQVVPAVLRLVDHPLHTRTLVGMPVCVMDPVECDAVQDDPATGSGGEPVLAWCLFDGCDFPCVGARIVDADSCPRQLHPGGRYNVSTDILPVDLDANHDSATTCPRTIGPELFELMRMMRAHNRVVLANAPEWVACQQPEHTLDAHDSDDLQARWSLRQDSLPIETQTHEARGVGVLAKVLAQQNAGASLFLRTIVCVASLACCLHSILVLGERPSSTIGSR